MCLLVANFVPNADATNEQVVHPFNARQAQHNALEQRTGHPNHIVLSVQFLRNLNDLGGA